MFKTDVDPEKYVEEHGMKQDNDEDALREIVKKVIEENPCLLYTSIENH